MFDIPIQCCENRRERRTRVDLMSQVSVMVKLRKITLGYDGLCVCFQKVSLEWGECIMFPQSKLQRVDDFLIIQLFFSSETRFSAHYWVLLAVTITLSFIVSAMVVNIVCSRCHRRSPSKLLPFQEVYPDNAVFRVTSPRRVVLCCLDKSCV